MLVTHSKSDNWAGIRDPSIRNRGGVTHTEGSLQTESVHVHACNSVSISHVPGETLLG